MVNGSAALIAKRKEADGAAGRFLKAPADHEPVIPAGTTVVVVVAGLKAVGGRIADVAHRPERVASLLRSGPFPSRNPDDNLADLEGHARDFEDRTGFTYSILDGNEVIGCVYIYPSRDADHDAAVRSWVRASRADLDEPVWRTLSRWIEDSWPFANPSYASR